MAASSVIIPAHNSEHSISVTLDSVFNQSRTAREIIVVDDGSTDNTVDIVRRYGGRVTLLRQENRGQGAARNAGLKVASGRYIAFLDADDYWKPDFIEMMETFMDGNPRAVAASCAFLVKRARGDYFGPSHYEELRRDYSAGLILDDFFSFWALHDHVRTGTVLMRREVVQRVGMQNEDLRISQDLEYWGLLATAGYWGLLPEVLWVGTSDAMARKSGWRKKYAQRRRKTPKVKEWQARILPLLSQDQLPAFYKVRGRVAAGFMLNHALGGDMTKARALFRDYSDDMPDGRSIRILKIGNRLGSPGWWLACLALRAHDKLK